MRDGINVALLGTPAVALVTSEFWAQGDFVAQAAGMPAVPRVQLPHPVAATGRARMREIALDLSAEILSALSGTPA